MKQPVTLVVPTIPTNPISKERVTRYAEASHRRLPFVLDGQEALDRVRLREVELPKRLLESQNQALADCEPTTARRRIRRGVVD